LEELESAKKIIDILQEELNTMEQQKATGNKDTTPHNLQDSDGDIHHGGMRWKKIANKRKNVEQKVT
jgi:hypothetical protein